MPCMRDRVRSCQRYKCLVFIKLSYLVILAETEKQKKWFKTKKKQKCVNFGWSGLLRGKMKMLLLQKIQGQHPPLFTKFNDSFLRCWGTGYTLAHFSVPMLGTSAARELYPMSGSREHAFPFFCSNFRNERHSMNVGYHINLVYKSFKVFFL